jgi:hypothetical protein
LKVSGGVTVTTNGICNSDTNTTNLHPNDTNISTTTPDLEPPVIQILGNNPAAISVGSTYSDNGAIVTDNVDSNLGYQIYFNGNLVNEIQLDTSTTTPQGGGHSIEYRAQDQAGNIGNATRIVNVTDN